MARLPQPGSDDGRWGEILNDYLRQSHNNDGTIKLGAISKSDIGLGNVNNTSDANKPVSLPTQAALDLKLATSDLDDATATNIADTSTATASALGTVTNDAIANHIAEADPHSGYVLESIVDAKGDLIVGSANNTVTRTAVGTNGQSLIADSTSASGVAWANTIPQSAFDTLGPYIGPAYLIGVPGGTLTTYANLGWCAVPIYMPRAITVDQVMVIATVAAGAGGTVDLALYTGFHRNLSLLHNFGSVSSAGVTGSIAFTGSWVIPQGLIWLTINIATASPTLRGATSGPGFVLPHNDLTASHSNLAGTAWTAGSPPSTLASVSNAPGNNLPKFGLRRVA